MYSFRIGKEILYKPGIPDLAFEESPRVEFELNSAGIFDFTMTPKHPFYDKLKQFKTYIDMYDGDKWMWSFRVLNIEETFWKNRKVECEGILNFLLDSKQRPYEFTGGISAFLTKTIDVHNAQVDVDKKLVVGKVTVIDNNDYINRSSGHYKNTLETIREKLIETHGGYIRIRKENGINYIDYINDYEKLNSQVIRFGETLLDLNNYIRGDLVKTVIIPLGAELEDEENGEGINGVRKRVTIESVNDGKDYIYSEEGAEEFGYISDTVEFDDVTLPENLLKKAKAYLEDSKNLDVSLELTAVDLSYVDINIETIKLGDWQPVMSIPHGLNRNFLVSKMSIDIENPNRSSLQLGSAIDTMTSSTVSSNKDLSAKVEKTADSTYKFINDAVDHATDLITGGSGGYIVIQRDAQGHPQEILILDAPEIDQAKNIVRLNKNGIGFSNTGIDGPYRNAWTIDGKLNADFLTAGVIRGLQIIGADIQSNTNGYKALQIINGMVNFYDWKTTNHWIGKITPAVQTGTTKAILAWTHAKSSALAIGYHKTDDQSSDAYTNYIRFDKYGSTHAINVIEQMNIASTLYFREKHSIYESSSPNLVINSLNGVVIQSYATKTGANPKSWLILDRSGLAVNGTLRATGTKTRIVETKNYGKRKLNALETPDALFEDNGTGQLDDSGFCKITIDPIFLECVDLSKGYYVQLTQLGKGEIYIDAKGSDGFIVKGTPRLEFDWCLKARQYDYASIRFEEELSEFKPEGASEEEESNG